MGMIRLHLSPARPAAKACHGCRQRHTGCHSGCHSGCPEYAAELLLTILSGAEAASNCQLALDMYHIERHRRRKGLIL